MRILLNLCLALTTSSGLSLKAKSLQKKIQNISFVLRIYRYSSELRVLTLIQHSIGEDSRPILLGVYQS